MSGSEEAPIRPRSIDDLSRIVLPPEVRDALRVRPGDYVSFEVTKGVVRVRKVRWETV